MQKASAGLDRAKEVEKELKKEQKRADKAEKENAQSSQSLKEARAEVETLKGELADLRKRSEEVEHGLSDQLTAAEAKAEAEYDRAVLEVTENYKPQMPAVQDAVWGAAWKRCLSKLGVDPTSPLWTNMELPSGANAAEADLDAGALSNSEALAEPPQIDETGAADGFAASNVADPTPATVVNEHSEEA